jgi:hypothetical protein
MRTIDMPHEVKNATWNHLVYGNLLDAFLSSSHELFWAVDTNKKVILANEAYKQFILQTTGEHLKIDDPVLSAVGDKEIADRWNGFYNRALQGERFSVITNCVALHQPVMIDASFIPLRYQDHVMGTACVARNSARYKKESILDDMILE